MRWFALGCLGLLFAGHALWASEEFEEKRKGRWLLGLGYLKPISKSTPIVSQWCLACRLRRRPESSKANIFILMRGQRIQESPVFNCHGRAITF